MKNRHIIYHQQYFATVNCLSHQQSINQQSLLSVARTTMTNVFVAVGRCHDPVLQNIAFVVESIQTLFLDFYCLEDVIGRLKFTKFAACRLLGFENAKNVCGARSF